MFNIFSPFKYLYFVFSWKCSQMYKFFSKNMHKNKKVCNICNLLNVGDRFLKLGTFSQQLHLSSNIQTYKRIAKYSVYIWDITYFIKEQMLILIFLSCLTNYSNIPDSYVLNWQHSPRKFWQFLVFVSVTGLGIGQSEHRCYDNIIQIPVVNSLPVVFCKSLEISALCINI